METMSNDLGKVKEKLNIALVCDAVTDCVAGSFISTLRFSELLAKRGHKVIFIAARSPRFPKNSMHGSIKAYRFPGFLMPKSEGQLYISLPRTKQIKKILEDEGVHVVHTTIPTPAAIAATRAARALGLPIVAHSHTQPENLTMHIPNSAIRKPIDRYFYRYLSWLYGQANALIYPSQFALDRLSEIHADVKKLVISNGVDTKKFSRVETDDLFKKFNLPRNTDNILYVGRLHPEKSVDTLIKAMPLVLKEHPDTHLFIAGFGHLDTKLEALSRELKVHNAITFLGKVSDAELVAAYTACDIFVLPSLAELEGMAVLEAMSCGKPIIIANSPESASTYFVDDNGYLFKPEDPHDLSLQLSKLLSDKGLRKEMGDRSLIKIRDYDINESVRRIEELYYSLLKKNE